VVEGLKPWRFSNNKTEFGAEVSYAAPLPLEESATEMLWQSSPEPGGWDAALSPTALKFSLPRAAASARLEPQCAKASAAWHTGNHEPAGFGVASKQMLTFIVYFITKAFEDLKKKKKKLI